MEKICPNCGASMPDSSKFCTECGKPFPVPQPKQEQKKPEPPRQPVTQIPQNGEDPMAATRPLTYPEQNRPTASPAAPQSNVQPQTQTQPQMQTQPAQTAQTAQQTCRPASPASAAQTYQPNGQPKAQPTGTYYPTGNPAYTAANGIPGSDSPYQPLSTWGWFGTLLLLSIPVIGFILTIVWACGGCRKINKRNYCRALLVNLVLSLILLGVIFGVSYSVLVKVLEDPATQEALPGLLERLFGSAGL